MHNNHYKKIVQLPILTLAVATATQAWAQQDGSSHLMLEEIVVTAEHREASLQDTQISITALTEDDIKELGISNAEDLTGVTPNVQIAPLAAGRAGVSIAMRGVRQGESQVSFDPAVGMYMDGVLIAKGTGSLLDVAEIERIEVLRGPQGTLYGRNTIGGAISFITKKPADEFEASLEGTLGSFNQQNVRGMINLPMGEQFAARVSVASLQRDALYDNEFPGTEYPEVGDKDRTAVTAHLQWTPNDRTKVLYSYDQSRIDETGTPNFVTFVPNSTDPLLPGVPTEYVEGKGEWPDTGSWDGPFSSELEVDGHALNISYDIGDNVTFHSITAHRDMWNHGIADADGGPSTRLNTDDEQEDKIFTQEFRLVGAAMDQRLSYSVGAYYMDEKGDMDTNVILFGGLIVIPTIVEFANKSYALYGQGTYDLTDALHLTLGARYTTEDREMTKETVGSGDRSFNNVSPLVSLAYDWNDDVMTYFKIARGYNSGGFNSRLGTQADPVTGELYFEKGFDEELLTAYELGWKATLADSRVRWNGAFFYSDYTDKQVSQLVDAATNLLTNAGTVAVYGVESELRAALTENLEFGWDYGYTDAEFKKWDDPILGDLTNSNFAYAPKHTSNMFLTYFFPQMDIGTLSARLDYTYRSSIHFLSKEVEINGSDSLGLWNGRLTLNDVKGPGDSTIRVSAWVKNITDEGYWNFGVDQLNVSVLSVAFNGYGEPRTVGLDASISF